MRNNQKRQAGSSFWQTATDLPPNVFKAWQKHDGGISPVAIVATVDPDGSPRAVPFGSLIAITPRLLRLCCNYDHCTFDNLCLNGQATIVMVSPPDISVSVLGKARLLRDRMLHDEKFAIVDIDVIEVKNDMAYRIVIDSGIMIHARDQFKPWYEAAMAELKQATY